MNQTAHTLVRLLAITFCLCRPVFPQNAIVAVIDGARFSETLGARDRYIPRMWNDLRPQGTIYTRFYNNGTTETNSGFSSLVTGVWQHIANDGSAYPEKPTVFEYFRKHTSAPESTCFVIAGKEKLHVLSSSRAPEYGADFRAAWRTSDLFSDLDTWEQVLEVLDRTRPRLVVVGFPDVDREGHRGRWERYLRALRRADSLIAQLWEKVQTDTFYRNTTTLFVTNDHGRHTEETRGFQNHGDSCEGCRHIMLLALGPGFPPNTVVSDSTFQIDIAPTIGAILGFPTPHARGRNLLLRDGKGETH